MLVLFDQATPAPLRKFLAEHTVNTAWEQGWDRLRNGDLLKAAEEAGFQVFITPDQGMRYQQNLQERKIALVVLGKNRWKLVKQHAAEILDAVNTATPGSYRHIEIALERPDGGPWTKRQTGEN